MPIFIINLREGPDIAVEGAGLHLHFKEGCSIPLIAVVDSGQNRVAVVPSDAVRVVYRKDVEKAIE